MRVSNERLTVLSVLVFGNFAWTMDECFNALTSAYTCCLWTKIANWVKRLIYPLIDDGLAKHPISKPSAGHFPNRTFA
jgi:hypothetical protein